MGPKCKKCGTAISNKKNKLYCSLKCYQSTLKGAGNPMFGRKRLKYVIDAIIKANKARKGVWKRKPFTEEHKNKIRKAAKERYAKYGNPGKMQFDVKEIKKLYLEKGQNLIEISKKYNCSMGPIKRALVEEKVKLRTPGESQQGRIKTKNGFLKIPRNKLEYLIKNYPNNENSYLADKLNLSKSQISNIASKNNLKKTKEHRKKISKKIGKETYSKGLGIGGMTYEKRVQVGKMAYSKGIAKLSKEEISNIGKMGAAAAYKKMVDDGRLPELQERMRKISLKKIQRLKDEGKFLEFQKNARLQIPKRDTKIELAISAGLKNREYKIIEMEDIPTTLIGKKTIVAQYEFEDLFWIDFAMPKLKLAIECQGDWHHVNPETNNPDKELHKIQIKTIERDKKRIKILNSFGWRVLMIWGKDIKENLDDCLDMIEKNIKKKK